MIACVCVCVCVSVCACTGKTVVLPEGSPTLHITNIDKANRLTALPLPICTLQLPAARPPTEFAGPRIRMALPSFSGATPACPQLLKYACDLWTNVRFVAPARVLSTQPVAQQDNSKGVNKGDQSSLEELCELLSGKPLLCMAFDNMEVSVLCVCVCVCVCVLRCNTMPPGK